MKRCIAVGLLWMLFLSLVGCGADTALREPPALSVVCGQGKTAAWRGGISWYGGGAYMTTAAHHPLDSKAYMTPLVLAAEAISDELLTGSLQWEVMPDTVSVRCWSGEFWGQHDAPHEEVPVITADAAIPAEVGRNYAIQLKDGEYIYEVEAVWNRTEAYGGNASYAFYTVKKDAVG